MHNDLSLKVFKCVFHEKNEWHQLVVWAHSAYSKVLKWQCDADHWGAVQNLQEKVLRFSLFDGIPHMEETFFENWQQE